MTRLASPEKNDVDAALIDLIPDDEWTTEADLENAAATAGVSLYAPIRSHIRRLRRRGWVVVTARGIQRTPKGHDRA